MLSVRALIRQPRRFLSHKERMQQLGGKDSYSISNWNLWHCSQMCGHVGEHCGIRNPLERKIWPKALLWTSVLSFDQTFLGVKLQLWAKPKHDMQYLPLNFSYLIVKTKSLPCSRLSCLKKSCYIWSSQCALPSFVSSPCPCKLGKMAGRHSKVGAA